MEAHSHRNLFPLYLGPLRRPGVYNLQSRFENNALVGPSIFQSRTRWLNAQEITMILDQFYYLAISIPRPQRGALGLFLYNTPSYRDNGRWQHLGPNELGIRRRIRHNEYSVEMTESIGWIDDRYRKRVYRLCGRNRHLKLVHYRRMP